MSLDDGIAVLHVHVLINVVVESGATTGRPLSTNNVVYRGFTKWHLNAYLSV